MNVVIDTNVAVSGLLWGGPPNQILKWARNGIIRIPSCEKSVDELKKVLEYPKFSARIASLDQTPLGIMAYFLSLVTLVPDPSEVPTAIKADPFDNLFLALAEENSAVLIVSGDKHLLDIQSFAGIQIVTPSQGVETIIYLRQTSEF